MKFAGNENTELLANEMNKKDAVLIFTVIKIFILLEADFLSFNCNILFLS